MYIYYEIVHTKTFALIGGAINEDLAANHVAKREKHLHQFSVSKFLWQVVNEEVAALGPRYGASWEHEKIFKELTNLPLNTAIRIKIYLDRLSGR